MSAEEFALTLSAFSGGARGGVEEISAWVGLGPELVAIVAAGDADALLAWLLGGFPRALAELDRALPEGSPGIFARVPPAASPGALNETVTSSIRIAEAAPRMELALGVTEGELTAWLQGADARERHLVREGLIQIAAAVAPKASPGRRVSADADEVRAVDGAQPASDVPSRLEYDAAELARSRAERTLFEHLEKRTRTRGLFRLNGVIAEPFGDRPLEVDLLSEELRVALEIDGYHHFRDAVAYRRDRDKDVRLQRLGYTVVRVLAADVGGELDYVTDTIDRVVDHEKQRAP